MHSLLLLQKLGVCRRQHHGHGPPEPALLPSSPCPPLGRHRDTAQSLTPPRTDQSWSRRDLLPALGGCGAVETPKAGDVRGGWRQCAGSVTGWHLLHPPGVMPPLSAPTFRDRGDKRPQDLRARLGLAGCDTERNQEPPAAAEELRPAGSSSGMEQSISHVALGAEPPGCRRGE